MSAEPKSDPDAMLLREDAGGITTLTLNRPDARNALSRAMIAAIQEELDTIADNPSVRTVVFAANGTAFVPDMTCVNWSPISHLNSTTSYFTPAAG